MTKFYDDAKTELDPYYQEQFDIQKKNTLSSLGFLQQSQAEQEALQKEQFNQERQQLAEQATEAGMAYSSLRKGAEERMRNQQRGIVTSNRREILQRLQQTGSALEQAFGEKARGLPLNVPTGEYNELGLGAQQLAYDPLNVKYGTAQKEQITNIKLRQDELARDALAKKQGLLTGTYPNA